MSQSRDTSRGGADPARRLPFKGKRRLYDVIKVRFPNSVKPVECDTSDVYVDGNTDVVVRTRRGPVLARTIGTRYRKVLPLDVLQPIERTATQRDLDRQQENEALARESLVAAVRASRQMRLDMKFITAEIMLDRRRTVLYFSAENRVDFRQLVRQLSRELRTRIEMHQVGVRNGAGMLGGVGSCGRELCCSTFLTDFEPVAIRMVKDQGLTLNPKKVSGMCGRLMCCLVYEHSGYVRGRKRLPRRRSLVRTRQGLGRVRSFDIVQETVSVRHEDGTDQDWPLLEVIVDPDDTEPDGPSEPLVFTIDGPVTADEAARRATDAPPEPGVRRRRGRSNQRGGGGGGRGRGRSEKRGRGRGRSNTPANPDADRSDTQPSTDDGDSSRRRRRRRRRGRSKPADGQPTGGNDSGTQRAGDAGREQRDGGDGNDNRQGRRRRRRGRSKGNRGGSEGAGNPTDARNDTNSSGDGDSSRRRRRRRRRGRSGGRGGEGGGNGGGGGGGGGSAD